MAFFKEEIVEIQVFSWRRNGALAHMDPELTEYAVNMFVRHCRIGKVTLKTSEPPKKSAFWRISDWLFEPTIPY